MTKEIKAEILIHATPQRVWSILTDFDHYPTWNPFIKWIKGEVKVGEKITARIEPPGAKGMIFTPRVLTLDVNRKLSWLGHLYFKGLFDGEHQFELVDNGDGTTRFIQCERFRGLLVPLFKKMLDHQTLNGFREMNGALKALAEKNDL